MILLNHRKRYTQLKIWSTDVKIITAPKKCKNLDKTKNPEITLFEITK